jgi:hypothetical protein
MKFKIIVCGLDSSGSGQDTFVGSCEHGNETLGSIKGWELLDYLDVNELLKENFALWLWLVLSRHIRLKRLRTPTKNMPGHLFSGPEHPNTKPECERLNRNIH